MSRAAIVFAVLAGCGGGAPSSADVAAPANEAGAEKLKPGTLVAPAEVSKPGAPAVALTKDQCGDTPPGGAIDDLGVTGTIRCGETVTGHTRGGANIYDSRFYEKNFCTPATTSHATGDERIYKLELPDPRTRAIVYLDTPCGNLDLAAFLAKADAPPGPTDSVRQCEMNLKGDKPRESVDLQNIDPATWWLVVEGQGDAEGAFALTVQCEKM